MKKIILALFALVINTPMFAGEPPAIIAELHELMEDAPKGFPKIIGSETSRDEDGGFVYYEAKTPVSDLAFNTLFDKIGTKDRIYMIYYDKEEADESQLKRISEIKMKYESELSTMQASGKYRVSHFEVAEHLGEEVFEVNDLNGERILEYHSNNEAITIMFWGTSS